MSNTFLVSDTHFGHLGVCKFLGKDSVTKLRPWDTPEEMDEAMVARWNQAVKPQDKVYHLGDAVINRKALKTLARLNGRKILIKGNHDIFKLEDYVPYFQDIRAYHVLDNKILSHIPVFRDGLYRFSTNIHGHLHDRQVMLDGAPDPKYYSVCVELHDFAPVEWSVVNKAIASLV